MEQQKIETRKFRFSIKAALILTGIVAFYSAILGLAFRGDYWGKGITIAVTCSILIWTLSAFLFYPLMFAMAKAIGPREHVSPTHQGAGSVPVATPIRSDSGSSGGGGNKDGNSTASVFDDAQENSNEEGRS